jgi:hypothetical protein
MAVEAIHEAVGGSGALHHRSFGSSVDGAPADPGASRIGGIITPVPPKGARLSSVAGDVRQNVPGMRCEKAC